MAAAPIPLLHIGYPKTATTWLQKKLFQPEFGYTKALNHAEIHGGIIAPTAFTYIPLFAQERFQSNLNDVKDTIPVVSSEILSGNIYCGGYNAKQNADRLYETFPQAKVLIVTREQKSLIRALYKTQVQWGMPHSIKRILVPIEAHRFPQFNLDYLRFNLIAQYYKGLYGESNVLVIPYELFLREPRLFLEEIVTFSGSTVDVDMLLAKPNLLRRQNETRRMSLIIFQRWFNYIFISNALNYSGLITSKVNEGAYRARRYLDFLKLPAFLDKRLESRFRQEVERHTRGEFSQSNHLLQAMCDHNLKELGYEM